MTGHPLHEKEAQYTVGQKNAIGQTYEKPATQVSVDQKAFNLNPYKNIIINSEPRLRFVTSLNHAKFPQNDY